MSDFDELLLDKSASPKLKVAGDDRLKVCDDATAAGEPGLDDSGEKASSSSETEKQSSESKSPTKSPTGMKSTDGSLKSTDGNQPIEVLQDIRDRAADEKRKRLQPQAELEMENNTIASLGKPVFILIFLLVLPWVVTNGVITDWSCAQRQRCGLLGDTAMRDGQLAKAKGCFEAAIAALNNREAENVPDRKAFSLSRLGAVNYVENHLKQAAADYETAANTAEHPGQKAEHFNAASTVQSQLGNLAKSEALAQQALALVANDQGPAGQYHQGHALLNLAFDHFKAAKYQQALVEAASAKTLLPSSGYVCADNLMGDIYRAMGDKSKAIEAYENGSSNLTEEWAEYCRRNNFSGFSSGSYRQYREYYMNALRAKALALYLQGDAQGARTFIEGALRLAKMNDLSGDNDLPPMYPKDAIAQLRDMINAAVNQSPQESVK